MRTEKYDIILAGSGMAGLSLVYRGLKEGIWKTERILIIDEIVKSKNDRTWCFWQQSGAESPFESVIYRKWKNLFFFTNDGRKIVLDTGDYVYNMIRSDRFYKHTIEFIKTFSNVSFAQEKIVSITSEPNGARVQTSLSNYAGTYIFNSIYTKPDLKQSNQYFLQHFKGVTICTEAFRGNSGEMHLMDFRTSQEHGATFFYVLPLNEHEIFLEYTIFSKSLLSPEQYDIKIKKYISEVLKIDDYEVLESEFGVIPMTDFSFKRRSGNVMNIGIAGGDTRGSSGYTFTNTQKTISGILASFKTNGHPFFNEENIGNKHKLLDATILKVLDEHIYPGDQIFSDLFTHVKAKNIFAFLDSRSTLLEDLQVMWSLKAKHFIGPFFQVIMDRIKDK